MKHETLPFNASEQRFYQRLIDHSGSTLTPRLLWRAMHSRPHLETGRIREIRNRVWLVPSSRHAGVVYRVDLKTGLCVKGDGEVCPDKTYNHKLRCAHFEAAIVAEREYLKEMAGGTIAEETKRTNKRAA